MPLRRGNLELLDNTRLQTALGASFTVPAALSEKPHSVLGLANAAFEKGDEAPAPALYVATMNERVDDAPRGFAYRPSWAATVTATIACCTYEENFLGWRGISLTAEGLEEDEDLHMYYIQASGANATLRLVQGRPTTSWSEGSTFGLETAELAVAATEHVTLAARDFFEKVGDLALTRPQ